MMVILSKRESLYRYCKGEWTDVTQFFGIDWDHLTVNRIGQQYYVVGSSTDPKYSLVDVLNRTNIPFTVVQRERFTDIHQYTLDGTVWWKGLKRSGNIIWKHQNGKNAVVYSRFGTSGFEITPSGACCWTVNAGSGRIGSHEFQGLVPGFTTVLYWASYPGRDGRAVASAGTIQTPRFIDAAHIAYWSNGTFDKAASRKQWILNVVDLSSGSVKEIYRDTVGDWKTSGVNPPPLISGRGVLAWPTDWFGGSMAETHTWMVMNGNGIRTLYLPRLTPVINDRSDFRDGRLISINSYTMSIVIDELDSGRRFIIPSQWRSCEWAEAIDLK